MTVPEQPIPSVVVKRDVTDRLLGPLNDVETKHAPGELYYAGHAALLRRSPRVAVVGSRSASDEALDRAAQLVNCLVRTDAVVVSGLAMGIDTVAHRTAIDQGGRTIAVLGTPLDVFTPRDNRPLQELIMREHLAVSQFASGTTVQRHHFPMRNRTMALICDCSVIVEAGDGSGTLSQGWEALRLGRPLFIMSEVLANQQLEWPSKMISYGAQILSSDFSALFDYLSTVGDDSAANEQLQLSYIQHAF